MKEVNNLEKNKELRKEILRESSEFIAEGMRSLEEKENEKKREEALKETSEKLADYMRKLEK